MISAEQEGKLTLNNFLQTYVKPTNEPLIPVIFELSSAIREFATILRTVSVTSAGTTNKFGDEQLTVDIISDKLFF